jgi:hypothetical protein
MTDEPGPGTAPDNTGPQQRGRPFAPGQSGNPAGRPRGARSAALMALDAIGTAAGESILQGVIKAAQEGDMRAAEVLLRRLWPERKGRPITVELPPMQTAADLPNVLGALAEAVACGDLTPEEGQAMAAICETQRRAIETADLDRRLAALEAAQGGRK